MSISCLLFVGCAKPCPSVVVTKVVEKKVPVKCNLPEVSKPDYNNLNRAQKLYTFIQYSKTSELAMDACKKDINNTETK